MLISRRVRIELDWRARQAVMLILECVRRGVRGSAQGILLWMMVDGLGERLVMVRIERPVRGLLEMLKCSGMQCSELLESGHGGDSFVDLHGGRLTLL
jgi:hypothetical protein